MRLSQIVRKIEKRIRLKISNEVNIRKIEELAITPTMKCCLNCAMCHQKEIKHWPNMNYEDFKKMLVNLKKEGVRKISLVGGEIFVHPEMWKFIELMEEMNFQYDLSSNLFFVPGGVERFSKLKHLEMVTTSIDDLGNKHSKIRGVPGAFERTINNIKKIVSMKIPIDVACVVQKANIDHLEDIVEFICKLKVTSITLLVENNLSEEEKEVNRKIIRKITGKDSEILVSAIKNPLGTMNEKDWEIIIEKLDKIRQMAKRYKVSLGLSAQLSNPDLLKKNISLKNYTCGIFKGYNMIGYNKCELPFCGFIKLNGDYNFSKDMPRKVVNNESYIKLRTAFKKYGALPMCRMCCALKNK
jgi:MoaA/NifB/PqqE/SkfB family radical SAM enzyme